MSDNIPLYRQRQCAAKFICEDEKYIIDIFSCVQPNVHGQGESRKQLVVFITRAMENNRLPFLQEEQTRLGMIRVYHDRICWKKKKADEMLIVQMKMEDFTSTSEPIERRKIDQMRIPEKVTFTLPSCDASVMKLTTKLLNDSIHGEVLLETEQLKASLSEVPHQETKPGVEHDHITSRTTEHGVVAVEQIST